MSVDLQSSLILGFSQFLRLLMCGNLCALTTKSFSPWGQRQKENARFGLGPALVMLAEQNELSVGVQGGC